MPTLILDNGGGKIKAGFLETSGTELEGSLISLTNASAKVEKSMQVLVGEQLDAPLMNGSNFKLSRPFERGYLTNWQTEIEVWTRLLTNKSLCPCNPAETTLVLTESILNPVSIQNDLNELVFEYFGFQDYVRKPSIWFSAYQSGSIPSNTYTNNSRFSSLNSLEPNYPLIDCYIHTTDSFDVNNNYYMDGSARNTTFPPGCMIVESGFSYTHVAPFINGKCVRHALKRLNIGGKLLTNYLKELVSYRQWNMMDETILINSIKEQLCYVSSDIKKNLAPTVGLSRLAKTKLMKDYNNTSLKKNFVLPDFQNILVGYTKKDDELIQPNEQILTLETERFTVPELLFNPSLIDLNQGGIVDSLAQSLNMVKKYDPYLLSPATAPLFSNGSIQNYSPCSIVAGQKIVLTGGNFNFPNIFPRFIDNTLSNLPSSLERVQIELPRNPENFAWQGMRNYINDCYNSRYENELVSRSFYLEHGHDRVNHMFDSIW